MLHQEHRPLEVLVVDQSPQPSGPVAALTQKHPDLISYHNVDFRSLPQARNYGARHARYEAIVFVDDDIRCQPLFVSEHLRALRLPGIGIVAGSIHDHRAGRDGDERSPGRFNRWTGTPARGFDRRVECYVDHAPGGNFSIWRPVLAAAGGVDEALAGGAALYEETELCLRVRKAGYRIYFNGKARLQHLAAGAGGCHVKDISTYVVSLSHNRSLLIRRHLLWFQIPTAALRLAALVISYAWHYRSPGILLPALRAAARGFVAGGRPPFATAALPREVQVPNTTHKA